jgi:hypothetical protein
MINMVVNENENDLILQEGFFQLGTLLSLDLRQVGKRILFVLQSQNSADNTPRNLLGFSCVVSLDTTT